MLHGWTRDNIDNMNIDIIIITLIMIINIKNIINMFNSSTNMINADINMLHGWTRGDRRESPPAPLGGSGRRFRCVYIYIYIYICINNNYYYKCIYIYIYMYISSLVFCSPVSCSRRPPLVSLGSRSSLKDTVKGIDSGYSLQGGAVGGGCSALG